MTIGLRQLAAHRSALSAQNRVHTKIVPPSRGSAHRAREGVVHAVEQRLPGAQRVGLRILQWLPRPRQLRATGHRDAPGTGPKVVAIAKKTNGPAGTHRSQGAHSVKERERVTNGPQGAQSTEPRNRHVDPGAGSHTEQGDECPKTEARETRAGECRCCHLG